MTRAISFFGPEGLGLQVEERAACCARFVGGGGHVSLQIVEQAESGGIEVTLEGREWDSQIRQFLEKI